MLNVNENILDELNDSETFLLEHLARFGKNIFPSNDLLMLRTKWGKSKLDKHKKSLVDKGYVFVQKRFKFDENGKSVRDTNEYILKEGTIKQFLGKKRDAELNAKLKVENAALLNQIEELKLTIESLQKVDNSTPETKKKARKKKDPPSIDKCDFKEDFGEDLKELLFDFLKYKKEEKKETYKTQKSLQRVVDAFYDGAKKLGILAVKIALDSTKLNQYSGIFIKKPTKKELGNYGNEQIINGKKSGNIEESFATALQQGVYDNGDTKQNDTWTDDLFKDDSTVEQIFD